MTLNWGTSFVTVAIISFFITCNGQNADVDIETTPSNIRILDIPPYNDFVILCRVKINDTSQTDEVNIEWIRRAQQRAHCGDAIFTENGIDEYCNITDTTKDREGHHFRTISCNETDINHYLAYRCRARWNSNNHSGEKMYDTHIAVTKPSLPMVPENVHTFTYGNGTITVQWRVPFISYTPEVYYLVYGNNTECLEFEYGHEAECEKYLSSTNLTLETGQSIHLFNESYSLQLNSSDAYYYRVLAKNSRGCVASNLQEVGTTVLHVSVIALADEKYNLSCKIEEENNTTLNQLRCDGTPNDRDSCRTHSVLSWRNSSGLLTNSANLNTSDPGNYTCSARQVSTCSAEKVTDDVQEFTVQIISVQVEVKTEDRPYNATLFTGLNLTLTCSVTIPPEFTVPFDDISIQWMKDGDNIEYNCSDVILRPDGTCCPLHLVSLNNSHSGNYSCRVEVNSTSGHPWVVGSRTSEKRNVIIQELGMNTTISSSTKRLLDIAPYNLFEASCSASVTASGTNIYPEPQVQWNWRRNKIEYGENKSAAPFDLNAYSNIRDSVNKSGNVTYECVFRLVGVENGTTSAWTSAIVVGKSSPYPPQTNHTIAKDYVNVSWTIQSIAYTPESYRVIYWEENGSFDQSSETLLSGEDISVLNQSYTVMLKRLNPGTLYCYVVESINLSGTSSSVKTCFNTNPLGLINATVVNASAIKVTWVALDRFNISESYLVWVRLNSTDNHIQEVSPSETNLVIGGLRCETTYNVSVSIIRDSNVGKLQEAEESVTTDICGKFGTTFVPHANIKSTDDGSLLFVWITVGTIMLVLLIVIGMIILTFCIRRKRKRGSKPIVAENFRFSALVESILRGSLQSMTWSAHERRQTELERRAPPPTLPSRRRDEVSDDVQAEVDTVSHNERNETELDPPESSWDESEDGPELTSSQLDEIENAIFSHHLLQRQLSHEEDYPPQSEREEASMPHCPIQKATREVVELPNNPQRCHREGEDGEDDDCDTRATVIAGSWTNMTSVI